MAGRWGFDPVIYEVNTAAWLQELGCTLADVPATAWDRVTPSGVDAVWLMGVWQRSAAGLRLALDSPAHVAEFRDTLPDFMPDDVIGSAYSIAGYTPDARFGGEQGLAAARAALADRGVRLIVDFVPNHVAPDHPWLADHPEYFVRGDAADLARTPSEFLRVGEAIIARGRDPYFPPWPDVAQLDAFAPGQRRAAIDTLTGIGHVADGVRCDMAMLMLNDVFAHTWSERAAAPRLTEYWADVITEVRRVHPDMLFIAEAYWDLEWQLQQLGFDYCYDKRLYDRLIHDKADQVRDHLRSDLDYQQRLVRFIENHDEPRAALELSPARLRAAAVVVATLPGATLWHDGQFEGWSVHLPVLLGRRPVEPDDAELRAFHLQLVDVAHSIRAGIWQLCEATGWSDNASCAQLLAWSWRDGQRRALVVVNGGGAPATARVHMPWDDIASRTWVLDDRLSGDSYVRDGDDMAAHGLFIGLAPWASHLFVWSPAVEAARATLGDPDQES